MQILWSWLKDYIDLSQQTPQSIATVLTDLGIEVESLQTIPGLDSRVKIGEILSTKPHPNADSLSLCQVSIGSEELGIVCGAPNARPGIRVAVATVDTRLPGDIHIKKGKIRGEESAGMLCSTKELGLTTVDDGGIWELSEKYRVGTSLAEYHDTSDCLLELSLTPNRGDALSVIGIAREIGAKLQLPCKIPEIKGSARKADLATKSHCQLKINPDVGCQRFVALYGQGLKAVASPGWLQKRLTAVGVRPINLLVDATNYVMLESGQPIHAYDKRFLAKGILGVRPAVKGETLRTLAHTDVTLVPGDLLIHDGEKAVGLAGIMGGENSEVREDTTEIVIEVAHFNAAQIRKTARRLGLITDAAYRFERGIDQANLKWVAERTADIIIQGLAEQGIEGASFASEVLDHYPKEWVRPRIALRLPRIRKLLALPLLSAEQCIKHLQNLGFTLLDRTDERMLFEVPSWRHDIVREIDLIEEIARLEGYAKIPSELPRMDISPGYEDPFISFCEDIQKSMAMIGFSEILTYPFHAPADYQKMGVTTDHPLWPHVTLANPLSEEQGSLRTTLVPNLIQSALHNQNHGQLGSRLFQMGRGFFAKSSGDLTNYPLFQDVYRHPRHLSERGRTDANRITERHWLGGILTSPFLGKDWQTSTQEAGFFHGKQALLTLLKSLGLHGHHVMRSPLANELPFLHPGASAVLMIDQVACGFLGEIHPRVARDFGLRDDAHVVFECDLEKLFLGSQISLTCQSQTKRFPPVSRDLAFLVDQALPYGDFSDAISHGMEKTHLKSWDLFDAYQGDSIPSGKKSLAINVTFLASDKTLTDREIDKEIEQLKQILSTKFGAELRS